MRTFRNDARTEADAGVRTIQKFLEVKFRNDQILDGTQSFLKGDLVVDWQPKTIELTARCWIASTATRAETKAKPPLKLQKTTEIELALIDLEKSTDDEDIEKVAHRCRESDRRSEKFGKTK